MALPAFEDLAAEVQTVDARLFEYLTGFVSRSRLKRFEDALALRTRHITVVLEDFFQSQNASACLRSCECFGLQDVHVVERRNAFDAHPDIALGAIRWLTLHRYRGADDSNSCLHQLRSRGYRIVATTPDPGCCTPQDLDVSTPFALLFGTEQDGLTDETMAQADECVHIPMSGLTTSLNVSVSLAILVQQFAGRVRSETDNWQLSPADCAALREAWVLKSLGRKAEPLIRRFQAYHG